MKIDTLKLMISITKSKMIEMPEFDKIDGLQGNVGQNFEKLSNALYDAEQHLEKMENAAAVRKLFNQK